MKKLLLHCGYHKTGSSFIQTMFARNDTYLKSKGIFFPREGKYDEMRSGKITPGNGKGLALALREKEYKRTLNILQEWVEQARRNDCAALLISSELLFPSFAVAGAFDSLERAARAAGIGEIHALLFFRDPVAHALSLYAHRAKGGNVANFRDWLETGYETLGNIEKFLDAFEKTSIRWAFRTYVKDSEALVKMVFEDWLALERPEIPEEDGVNVSMTLSEIALLQEFKHLVKPESVKLISHALRKLPAELKAQDENLRKKYAQIAAGYLLQYNGLFGRANAFLPPTDQLGIMPLSAEAGQGELSTEPLSLTPQQIRAATEAIKASLSLEERMREWARRAIKRFRQAQGSNKTRRKPIL